MLQFRKKVISFFQKKQPLPFRAGQVRRGDLLYWTILGLLTIWHGYQALFFATTILQSVPPDESYHIHFIQFYTHALDPFFNYQATKFQLGSIERIPYLYHFLLSKLQMLNLTGLLDYLFLRRINVMISMGTVVLFIVFLRQITSNKLVHILSVFALTNTLMFQFISGSINYDNLVNLLSIALLVLLVFFLKYDSNSIPKILGIGIIICLGALTKLSFLPLAAVTVLIIGLGFFYRRKRYTSIRISELFTNKITLTFAVIFLFLFILVGERYAVNILRYQSLTPSCDELLTVEQCMKNGIFNRNYNLERDLDHLTLDDRREHRLSYIEYLPRWSFIMQMRTHGVFAHKTANKESWHLALYALISILGFLAIIRQIRWKDYVDMALLSILITYIFVLSFTVNYTNYWFHGIADLAVQGRYLFPVMFIFYALIFKYLIMISRNYVYQSIVSFIVISVFLSGGFFWFVSIPNDIATADFYNAWYNLTLLQNLEVFDYFYHMHIKE